MKKQVVLLSFLVLIMSANSQSINDLFFPTEVQVSWLGIDFSHVKLIGDFSQFGGAGEVSEFQIRDEYFPAWNRLILNEPEKYDLKGMIRNADLVYDIEMIAEINSAAAVEDMVSYNTPNYSKQDIETFVSVYDTKDKNGIGILFLAESLNKSMKEAYFHFVAIDMKSNKVLLQERLKGKPKGFGIRNYWAGAIHKVIKEISNNRYKDWESKYN